MVSATLLRDDVARVATSSLKVFDACLLPNGCLVAAPSHHPAYPARARGALFCWPGRELGFAITGMEALGQAVRQPLLSWLWDRADSFQETGLLFEDYHVNGIRRGREWQPDQAGTLLWALCRAPDSWDRLEAAVVRKLATALVGLWDGNDFRARYRDIWQERYADPAYGTHFPYSLAAAAAGLWLAAEVHGIQAWRVAAGQMAGRAADGWNARLGQFMRRFGRSGNDSNVDASLLGLIWPFSVVDDADRLHAIVESVEARLLSEIGVFRYVYDSYDGEVDAFGEDLRQGAGAWPLLTFWLAIAHSRLGDQARALQTFQIGLEAVDQDGFLPEQIFPPGDARVGVKPRLWSHMLFALAAEELGLLARRPDGPARGQP
ncbi:MAG TPA: hypothetical protein VFU72_16590 [Nitrolancea sp.]|nr:hypothetical protein [Nitrolancea sp.]